MSLGFIFDLDGVIVDTAKYHYVAWNQLAMHFGFEITEKQNEQLKGVSRRDSLELILQWGNIELSEQEKLEWLTTKNGWYLELIQNLSPAETLPGVVVFIEEAKVLGIKIALGSSSKNAKTILDKLNLIDHFDHIVDGNMTKRSKPNPEVFLQGSDALGLQPNQCVVFEDAPKGIKAANSGGFHTVGVLSNYNLEEADMQIESFYGMHCKAVFEHFNIKP